MNSKCILCGENIADDLLYLCESMPAVSQNLPKKKTDRACKPIDLRLCQCHGCGLVQFDCNPVPYYKDSTRAGERSKALIELRKKQYKLLIEKFDLYGKKILEVGAGKGGFLRTLKEMQEYNIDEYGIEYNPSFVDIAREKEKVNVFWGDPENESEKLKGAPYDAFVSFSYPARLINPNAMVKMVYNNLSCDGVGLVMVPSFEHLLKQEGFFDIAIDHIAYYSVDTLSRLFQNNGFDVLEYGEESQLYIYMFVKKRVKMDITSYWKRVFSLIEDTRQFVTHKKQEGKRIAIWCAGHFAFTVLSVAKLGDSVDYIIDNAEFKKGCYAPGSGVLIVGPEYYKENPVDVIMILGPIYVDEIVEEIKIKCSPKIEIVTLSGDGISIL